jgi:hypothetical protein
MLIKGFYKALVVLLIMSCILFLAPHARVRGEGFTLQGEGEERAVMEWFVTETGAGTACSRTSPGPLEYCVEVKAQSGDTVYVGEGHYQPTTFDTDLLYIDKSLRLVGSCTWGATGPVVCYPQNVAPPLHMSALDGNNMQRVITVLGTGISVSIEGFYIMRGNANNISPKPAGYIGAGGGIYAYDIEELVIKNNYIWDNKASSTGTVTTDYGSGGGVFASSINTTNIVENVFAFNVASSSLSTGWGGGLHVTSCEDVTIRSNTFHENMVGNSTTSSMGAGAYLVYIDNLVVYDNVFEYHNHTIRHDWIDGSALTLHGNITASNIDKNLFRLNHGSSIVDIEFLTGALTRNTFWDNEASYDLYISAENDIEIINNFFGKFWTRSSALAKELQETRGGLSTIIYLEKGCGWPVVDIINNTFALDDYAIWVDGDLDVSIERNIFTEFTSEAIHIYNLPNDNVSVTKNLFWNNASNGVPGTIFWVADPKLVDLWGGDFHLQEGSAAIDKDMVGCVAIDIDGQPRSIGLGCDIGADEYGFTHFLPFIRR